MSHDFPQLSVSKQARMSTQETRAGLSDQRNEASLRDLSLAVESGNFAPSSHIQIVRSASAFRRGPLYVFGRVLDVASFAMDTILSVDNKARIGATCLVCVNNFVDASRAIKSCGLSETGKIVADRDIGITQVKMDGLVLFVICVRKIDGRRFVKR